MSAERLLLLAHMQIAKLKEQMEAAKKAEAKAAAFDWLMARMQESYDGHVYLEGGPDMSINVRMVWGHRDRCGVLAEIRWEDQRDEPLDLLAAIEKSMGAKEQEIERELDSDEKWIDDEHREWYKKATEPRLAREAMRKRC